VRSNTIRSSFSKFCGLAFGLVVLAASGPSSKARTTAYWLDSTDGLELVSTKAEIVNYRGRRAPHLSPSQTQTDKSSMIALVTGTDFNDGTIEAEVAGVPITADGSDRPRFCRRRVSSATTWRESREHLSASNQWSRG
jgi:hypothetical protein